MNSLDETVKLLRKHYPYLASNFSVKRIGLFGSFVTGNPTKESDVDIFVELDEPLGLKFILLAEYLENILNRKVDVVTKDGLKKIRVKNVARSIKRDIIYV